LISGSVAPARLASAAEAGASVRVGRVEGVGEVTTRVGRRCGRSEGKRRYFGGFWAGGVVGVVAVLAVLAVEGVSTVGEDARRIGACISEMMALICCWRGIRDIVGNLATLEGDGGVCRRGDALGGEDGMEEVVGEKLLSRIRRLGIKLFSGGRGAFASGRDADGDSSPAFEISDCWSKGEESYEELVLLSLLSGVTAVSRVPNSESSSFSSSASCIVIDATDERFPGSFEVLSTVITNGLVG